MQETDFNRLLKLQQAIQTKQAVVSAEMPKLALSELTWILEAGLL